MSDIRRSLAEMQIGECRWVCSEEIHVYCSGTRRGGSYDPKVKAYKIVTPEEGFDEQDWVSFDEAASIVKAESRGT